MTKIADSAQTTQNQTIDEEMDELLHMKMYKDRFGELMDASWKYPELKFLRDMSADQAREWYNRMIITARAHNIDRSNIAELAIAVKKFRKERNTMKKSLNSAKPKT